MDEKIFFHHEEDRDPIWGQFCTLILPCRRHRSSYALRASEGRSGFAEGSEVHPKGEKYMTTPLKTARQIVILAKNYKQLIINNLIYNFTFFMKNAG